VGKRHKGVEEARVGGNLANEALQRRLIGVVRLCPAGVELCLLGCLWKSDERDREGI
jgi:hypothetical protein